MNLLASTKTGNCSLFEVVTNEISRALTRIDKNTLLRSYCHKVCIDNRLETVFGGKVKAPYERPSKKTPLSAIQAFWKRSPMTLSTEMLPTVLLKNNVSMLLAEMTQMTGRRSRRRPKRIFPRLGEVRAGLEPGKEPAPCLLEQYSWSMRWVWSWRRRIWSLWVIPGRSGKEKRVTVRLQRPLLRVCH